MKKFKVTIEGIAPILQSRHPNPTETAVIMKKDTGSRKKVKDLTDKEQFDMHAYRSKAGKFYQPSAQIEAALVKAAVSFQLKGQKTYKDLFRAGVLVDETEIEHKNQKFTPFGEYATNKTAGAVWVVRPRCDKWELSFNLNVILDEQIPEEVLKEVLEYSGIATGIGAWRPKFGRFIVKEFKQVK